MSASGVAHFSTSELAGTIGWPDLVCRDLARNSLQRCRRMPSAAAATSGPKLLDRVREAIRLRHYSPRTETAYVAWIRRFILFHGKRHPRDLGEAEVTALLSALARRGLSASSQNQALGALLFLYQVVLGQRAAG